MGTEFIITKKIEKISDNFLHIFSYVEDPYLKSLKLMSQNSCQFFVNNHQFSSFKNQNSKETKKLSLDLSEIIKNASSLDKYYNNEKILIKDLTDILIKLEAFFKFSTIVLPDTLNQHIIQHFSLPLKFSRLITLIIDFIDEKSDFLLNLINLVKFFLYKNSENHCLYFQEYYMEIFIELAYKFPEKIIDLFINIFGNFKKIIINNEEIYQRILTLFKYFNEKKEKNYKILNKIIILISYFLETKEIKNELEIPEYDLKIALFLSKNWTFSIDSIEKLIKKPNENYDKHDYLMQILNLIIKSLSNSFEAEVLTFFNNIFPIKPLTNLIKISGKKFKERKIFFDIFSILYIDPMDKLINGRSLFKKKSETYEEDNYYDTQYNIVVTFLQEEIFFTMKTDVLDPKIVHLDPSNYLLGSLIKSLKRLMDYFSNFKETDLSKLLKYGNEIENLNEFIWEKMENLRELLKGEPDIKKCIDPSDVELSALRESKEKISRMKTTILSINEACSRILQMSESFKKFAGPKKSFRILSKVFIKKKNLNKNLK